MAIRLTEEDEARQGGKRTRRNIKLQDLRSDDDDDDDDEAIVRNLVARGLLGTKLNRRTNEGPASYD